MATIYRHNAVRVLPRPLFPTASQEAQALERLLVAERRKYAELEAKYLALQSAIQRLYEAAQ